MDFILNDMNNLKLSEDVEMLKNSNLENIERINRLEEIILSKNKIIEDLTIRTESACIEVYMLTDKVESYEIKICELEKALHNSNMQISHHESRIESLEANLNESKEMLFNSASHNEHLLNMLSEIEMKNSY